MEKLKRMELRPADDPLRPHNPIGYSSPQLPVYLERHPHRRIRSRQGEGRVPFFIHNINIRPSGQEQPGGERDHFNS